MIYENVRRFHRGVNPRAVAVLWRARELSMINDVRFLGGHGSGTNPYNDNQTARGLRDVPAHDLASDALEYLAFLLPRQSVENLSQLTARLPEDCFPPPFGHEHNMAQKHFPIHK